MTTSVAWPKPSKQPSPRPAARSWARKTYTSNDKDFSAILAKVAEAKPDMIYLPDYYPIVNLVGAQAKDKGITVPMMGGDGWDSGDLDVKAADNGYYTNHYDAGDTRPIVQDFVKNYSAKYKDDKGSLCPGCAWRRWPTTRPI